MTDEQVKEALFQSWKRKRAQQMKESTCVVEQLGIMCGVVARIGSTSTDAIKALNRALYQCKPRKRFMKKRTPIRQKVYVLEA